MHFLSLPLFFFLLLTSFSLYTTKTLTFALTSPTDITALKAFKASIKPTSIPPWSCLATWQFSAADPCTVPRRTHFTCGVTCSYSTKYARVAQITLDSAGYSGQLSPLVSRLAELTTLDIADNQFYGPIPGSLSSLVNLQTLTLRSNSFSGSVPYSVTLLQSLESLDLSRNSLSGYLPKSMNRLLNLRRLDLSYNKLTGSIPKLPKNLIELALKSNSLTGSLSQYSFADLTQLAVVELSENSLSGTLDSWFFLLPSLQQIDLANNDLTGVEIPLPSKAGSDLVAVELGYNKITDKVPVNFAGYPRLSSLSMRYNKLRGGVPLEYSKSESLRRLFLDGNFLTGKPPAVFLKTDSMVSGSLGNNCLQSCPGNAKMCAPSQKPYSICKQAYGW